MKRKIGEWNEALSLPLDFENAQRLSKLKFDGDSALLSKISDYVIGNFNVEVKKLDGDEDIIFKLNRFVSALKRILFFRQVKSLPSAELDRSIGEAISGLTDNLTARYGSDVEAQYWIRAIKKLFREEKRSKDE